MPIKELVTQTLGQHIGGYEVHVPTGFTGNVYTNIGIWLADKKSVGISPVDVTNKVLVANNHGKGWLAFDEVSPCGSQLRTIFEVI
ncbi:hypothetical protein ACXHQJ_19960 [Vibrio vulnificus]|mgnify:CR=1 FL=1|uniref:hypothetical protein n=1 Tax=Vibrio diabolicus TaxID=50719 RepID=UPI003D7C7A51